VGTGISALRACVPPPTSFCGIKKHKEIPLLAPLLLFHSKTNQGFIKLFEMNGIFSIFYPNKR
jgi:hypothetical protein